MEYTAKRTDSLLAFEVVESSHKNTRIVTSSIVLYVVKVTINKG